MKIEEVIGHRIAAVREINDVTQQQLAEEVGELLGKKWSRQAVWSAEKGTRSFTAVELVAFAYALGVPVDRLLMPPHNVAAIDLPGGKQLGRDEIRRATMPRGSSRKVFDLMLESLGTLLTAHQGRVDFEQAEAQAIAALYDQLRIASEVVLDEEEGRDDGSTENPADSGR